MNTYQTILLILASNAVPAVLGFLLSEARHRIKELKKTKARD